MQIFSSYWRVAYAAIGATILLSTACSKDSSNPSTNSSNNSIVQIASNNFSLYMYYTALTATGYDDSLISTGPFTVLAPSNAAFQASGFLAGTDIIRAVDSMRKMIPYITLKQRLVIDSVTPVFDQPLQASNGKTLYLTRWINKRDTAVVINGVRISTLSKPAANGLLNISDGLIYPSAFGNVQAAVSGDPNLTLFNAVLMQSGVYNDLQKGGPYTVFAPVNAAFNAIGIFTTDSIYKMDPARLKTLAQAHIVQGRSFVYDYILKANEATNVYGETTVDGNALTIALVSNALQPGRFTSITLTSATASGVGLARMNVSSDNGVVHSINTLLKTNF